MKKNLLLVATVFYAIASVATPLLGFALLEPSLTNLLLISMLFVMSVFATAIYCDKWLQERKWERDISKAFKIHSRQEMKAMFKKLDEEEESNATLNEVFQKNRKEWAK